MISTTDIRALLGGSVTLTSRFIEVTLGVKAKQKIKKGVYWDAAQWPLIRDAFAEYVQALPSSTEIDDGL